MASFAIPSNVFEIEALEISLSGAEWAETTEVHIAHQPSHLLEMQRLLSQTLSAASANPKALRLQPLSMTAPPAELFLEPLSFPPSPTLSTSSTTSSRDDRTPEDIAFELVIDDHIRQDLAQIRAEAEAAARAARIAHAYSRKKRGTREKKKETAPTKEILRAKQAARRARKVKRRARAPEEASGADEAGARRM